MRLGGPENQSGRLAEGKNITPSPEFENQTVRFVANRYTACDTITCLVFLCGKSVFVLRMSIEVLCLLRIVMPNLCIFRFVLLVTSSSRLTFTTLERKNMRRRTVEV